MPIGDTYGASNIKIILDSKQVTFNSSSGSPFIDNNNRTQVPFRQTMEAFGCSVSWDANNRIAIAEKNGITVNVPINKSYILKDGKRINNDTIAIIKDGRTYLPIRVVLEAFNAKVDWNASSNSVIVTTKTTNTVNTVNGYKVIRVVDGDTIIVNINGKEERVRLIGVDTPESVHPDSNKNVEYGKIASAFTKNKLEGNTVTLEYDVQERDQYGRLLAYVYLGGQMFNKTLLAEGHAKVATYPPNVKYVSDFLSIQKTAQANKKGVWAYEPFNPVSEIKYTYIGNSNSMKFHKSTCQHASSIAPHNRVELQSRQQAIDAGYVPCKVCNP